MIGILLTFFTGEQPGEYKDFHYEPNVQQYQNGSLGFTHISKENEGQYLCEAKNNIGAGVSKVIFLRVNGKFSGNIIATFRHLLLSQTSQFILQPNCRDLIKFFSQWNTIYLPSFIRINFFPFVAAATKGDLPGKYYLAYCFESFSTSQWMLWLLLFLLLKQM